MKRQTQMVIATAVILSAGVVVNQDLPRRKALTPVETKAAEYLIKKQVSDPVNKAVAIVQHSKYPKVALATAVVESRVKPDAVGKVKELGAYQVRPEIWGAVADRLELQTRQHSQIVEDLLRENNWNWQKTLAAYNGTGKQADGYSRLVMRNMEETGLDR
jgi:soluble lytic murein transglycosylase-like protein